MTVGFRAFFVCDFDDGAANIGCCMLLTPPFAVALSKHRYITLLHELLQKLTEFAELGFPSHSGSLSFYNKHERDLQQLNFSLALSSFQSAVCLNFCTRSAASTNSTTTSIPIANHSNMAAATTSTPSLFSSVRVNVRLCGSVPRQDMETLSLTKSAPHVLRTLNGLNTSSYLAATNGSSDDCVRRDSSTLHTIGDTSNSTGSRPCSQLPNVQQSETLPIPSTMPQRRITPIEPPSWAVPASGEARLEVRWRLRLRDSFVRSIFHAPHDSFL